MDLQDFFEALPQAEIMGDEMRELLDKIMAIENPMDFDDDFATDAELEALESSLDNMEVGLPEANQFKNQISRARAIQTTKTAFI